MLQCDECGGIGGTHKASCSKLNKTLALDESMVKLVTTMRVQMGRWPTDEEVYAFIMGDDEQRADILAGLTKED